jgi:N utilization substance protein B
MRNRRRSRELALQALFYMDMSQQESIETLELYCATFKPAPQAVDFLIELVKGVLVYRESIDGIIEKFSSNWKVRRMSCVDRNILRIAAYEILFREDIPAKVSINEAIDIGKKFGTEESGAFINGILDTIHLANNNKQIALDAPRTQTSDG